MASIRKLKKDVNYVTYELLTECFMLRHFHPEVNEKKFGETISKLVNTRNELIHMINYPGQDEKTGKKMYYNNIREGMKELVSIMEKLTK